jgi:hypothetical protein
MARPENLSDGKSISVSLPQDTFEILSLLASRGKLGKTANEVAYYILVNQAEALYEDKKLHERRIILPDTNREGG